MNERIQELAEQARKYARDYVAECNHYGHYMEQNEYELRFEQTFAELLLQECAEVVDNHFESKTPGYPGDKIKQHFGVEE